MQRIKMSLRVCRILQLMVAIVVLGLSIKLYRDMNGGLEQCRGFMRTGPSKPGPICGALSTDGCLRRSVDSVEETCRDIFQDFPKILVTSTAVGGFGIFDALLELTIGNVPFLALLIVDAMAATIYLSTGVIFAKAYAHLPRVLFGNRYNACEVHSTCSIFPADVAFLFFGFVATVTAGLLVVFHRRARAVEDIELDGPGEGEH